MPAYWALLLLEQYAAVESQEELQRYATFIWVHLLAASSLLKVFLGPIFERYQIDAMF